MATQRNVAGQIRITGDGPTTNNIQALATWNVFTATIDTSTQTVRIDNGALGSASQALTPLDPTSLHLGSNNLETTFSHVSYAAFIAYSRVLTDAEEVQMRSYLKSTYGTP